MKKNQLPLLAPVIGVFGALIALCLQLWMLRSAVDARGLIIVTHPASVLSVLIPALALVGIFLCTRPLTGNGFYEDLQPASPLAAVGCVAAALAVGLETAKHLSGTKDILLIIGIALGTVAAVCMVTTAVLRLCGKHSLWIYLLHQPVLSAVFYFITMT